MGVVTVIPASGGAGLAVKAAGWQLPGRSELRTHGV